MKGPARGVIAGHYWRMAAWVGVFMVLGALAGAGVSPAIVYGVYPITVPLIVVGLAWAGIMAARAEWRRCGTGLAVAAVGAVGVFAGPPGAWFVAGVGFCAVLHHHSTSRRASDLSRARRVPDRPAPW